MVKDRLKKYLLEQKERQSDFCRKLGVSSGYISGMRKSIQPEKLTLIASHYPNLNIDWLLTGSGEMLREGGHEARQVRVTSVEIPLVTKFDYAGYQSGYEKKEYMETLPKVSLDIVDGPSQLQGRHVAFEVMGDAMYDGSIRSLEEGDLLCCREIRPEQYVGQSLQFDKRLFVIVHRHMGIIIRRITEHDVRGGTFTVHSLNADFPDESLAVSDVMQLLAVIQLKRKPIV